MDVKTFVLQTLLSLLATARNDDVASKRRPPDVVCAELEKTRDKQRAACTFNSLDGAKVTVYVFVERPERKAQK